MQFFFLETSFNVFLNTKGIKPFVLKFKFKIMDMQYFFYSLSRKMFIRPVKVQNTFIMHFCNLVLFFKNKPWWTVCSEVDFEKKTAELTSAISRIHVCNNARITIKPSLALWLIKCNET